MLAKKGESFSPTTGFDLPDGSTRSPDASWVNQEKMDSMTGEQIENEFIPVVPDFIVELRSKSDRLKKVKEKMEKSWIANGVKLAWLIDPYKEKAYIYRIDGSIETITDFNQKLSGENILSTSHQLIRYFMSAFFRYIPFKNKSVAELCTYF